jgi:hypothetical protein
MTNPADDAHPWVQLPDETARAYDAFRIYMRLGADRSHRKTADAMEQQQGKRPHLSQLGNWSSEHRWLERCAAYDSYVLSAEVDGYADQMASVRSYHLEITQELLTHLHSNLRLLKPGVDPSIRWTQALAVALKSQQQALQMREETSKNNGVLEQIMNHLRKLEAE